MRQVLIAWLFVAGSALAQTSSTLCQATAPPGDPVERQLIGCGEGFAENLLWHLDRADSVTGALDGKVTRTLTGRGVVIYVIDSGVLAAHDEFARATGSNVIAGIQWMTVPGCPNVATSPCWDSIPTFLVVAGHGTGVASVAAGRHTGIAPDASIVSVTPLPGNTAHYKTLLQRIIEHAFAPQTPAFRTAIISISSGPPLTTPRDAALDALMVRMTTGVDAGGNADPNGKRFLFVAAAGNYYAEPHSNQCGPGDAVILHPAILGRATEGIIAVGGIDRDNHYWAGACKGELVEMAAPAPDIFVASISSTDAYRFRPTFGLSGTSWSTPYVSGMAALWLERYPYLTPAQLESLLAASPSRVNGIPVPVMPDSDPGPAGPRRRSTRH
jgi:subtilisin family serine protease